MSIFTLTVSWSSIVGSMTISVSPLSFWNGNPIHFKEFVKKSSAKRAIIEIEVIKKANNPFDIFLSANGSAINVKSNFGKLAI